MRVEMRKEYQHKQNNGASSEKKKNIRYLKELRLHEKRAWTKEETQIERKMIGCGGTGRWRENRD